MTLPQTQAELLQHFGSFLAEAGLSSVSIKNYLSDLRHFLAYCQTAKINQSKPSVIEIFQNISKYTKEYQENQKSIFTPSNSINRRLASIRRFSTFLFTKYSISSTEIPQNVSSTPSSTLLSHAPIAPIITTTQPTSYSQKLLSQFRSFLESNKKSHSTVKNYISDVNHFLVWSANKTPFTPQSLSNIVSENQLSAYSAYQRLSHTAESLIARRGSSVKQFAKFCLSEGYIPTNPFEKEVVLPTLAPLSWLERLSAKRPRISVTKTSLNKSPLRNIYDRYNSNRFTPYFHLAILVLATSAMAMFAYDQIIKSVFPTQAAFPPTSLKRPNRQLSFQGRLTDSSKTPITTATNVVFKLFNASSGPTQLYTSGTCSITPDQDGIFNTLIGGGSCGSEIPADVFSDNLNVYIEVQVGAETLTPRQQIATVGYAINSETLQGYPATNSATENTIPVMNATGDIVLGSASPDIESTSGTFTLKGRSLTLSTAVGSSGNIVIQPDTAGSSNVQILTSGSTGNQLRIQNANLSTGNLISGYIGNNTDTPGLLVLSSGASEAEKFAVRADGQTRITTDASLTYAGLIVNQAGTGDIFTASQSGSPKFVISNGGNVGIGVTNPSNALDITGQARLTSTQPRLYLYSTGGASDNWSIYSDSSNSLYFRNDTDTANYMTIDGAGNVGVGLTNPSGKFDVAGDIYTSSGISTFRTAVSDGTVEASRFCTGDGETNCVTDFAGLTGVWQRNNGALSPLNITDSINLGATATTSATVHLAGLANENSFINTGRFGIGTTNPTALLDIAGTASSSGTISFRGTTDPKIDILNGEKLGFRTSVGGDASITERVTLANSGELGIGTTTPGALLQIRSSATSNLNRLISGPTYTVDGAAGTALFTANTWYEYPGIVGNGNATAALDIPSISAYGSVGVVGVGGSGTGGRTNVGVYGHAYMDAVTAGNSSNNVRGGFFTTRLTAATNDWAGSMYGVYASSNSTGGTSTGGAIYGVYGSSVGEANNTVYGGYFTGSGGTTNYGVYSAAGTNYFNGNVGIGITNPSATLDINGTASISGALTIAYNQKIRSAYGPLALQYKSAINTWADGIVVQDTTGNVGIKTNTPDYNLQIEGPAALDGTSPITIDINSTTNSNSWTVHSPMTRLNFSSQDASYVGSRASIAAINENATGSYTGIAFYTSRSTDGSPIERVYLDSLGNLGIATTTPAYPLDVNGSTRITNGQLSVGTGVPSSSRQIDIQSDWPSTSNSAYYGIYNITNATPADQSFAQVVSSFNRVTLSSTSWINDNLTAVRGQAYTALAGTANSLYGGNFNVTFADTITANATISAAINLDVDIEDGTSSNAYGIYAITPSVDTGSITTSAYGIRIDNGSIGSGSIAQLVPLYIDADSRTVTGAKYGLYIGTMSGGATNYELYIPGTADSYFAGNVGIAITNPGFGLEVNDTARINGAFTIGDASADTVTVNSAAWTFTNATTVALNSAVNSLNFDSNTLTIDAANNRVGIGLTNPQAPLDVTGDIYTSSGISTFRTAVSDGTVEATKICVGDGETDCVTSFASLTGVWQRNSGALSPLYITDAVNLGATATTSATVHLAGLAGDNSFINTGNFGVGLTNPGSKVSVAGGVGIGSGAYTTGAAPTNGLMVEGSVGIGITNPGFALEVAGTTRLDGAFTIGDASADTVTVNSAAWTFANASTIALNAAVNSLNFDSNTLTIDASNNRVGIGLTNPTTALQVSGDLRVTGAFYDSSNLPGTSGQLLQSTVTGTSWASVSSVNFWQRNSGALSPLELTNALNLGATATNSATVHLAGTSGDNSFVNTGNFGIGLTNPGFGLEVNGTARINGAFTIGDASADTVTVNSAAWTFANATTVALNSAVNSLNFDSNTLTIDAANNRVGIGLTNPTEALTLNGGDIDFTRGDTSAIHSLGTISFDWTAGTYDNSTFHGIESKDETGTLSDKIRINSYADIINTIDSNANSTSYFKVQKESVGDGTDLFTVDENGLTYILGNVGIGITNPTVALHVTGAMRLNGIFYDGSNQPGSSGQVLSSTGTATSWTSMSALNFWQRNSGALSPLELTNALNIGATATNSALAHFPGTNDQDAFVNLGTGDFGVGLTNPAYTLDVNGDLNVSNGTVGIGIATPNSTRQVNIESSWPLTNNTTYYGLINIANATPTDQSFAGVYGTYSRADLETTAWINDSVVGSRSLALANQAGTVNSLYSLHLQTYFADTVAANATTSAGIWMDSTDIEDGTSTNAYGIYTLTPSVDTGSITSAAYGIRIDNGTIGTGTIQSLAGLYIDADSRAVTGNKYAMYLGTMSGGANNWELYVPGTADSYFAGNVGIAITNPGFGLEVNDTARINGAFTIGDASADTVTVNSAAWTFANASTIALNAAVNSLNFDSNTLTIDASNNRVGIGLTNPGSALSVSGGIGVGSGTYITGAAPTNGLIVEGNVGFGLTNPGSDLSVSGGVGIGSGTYITGTAPTNGLIVQGNVGIGTTSPTTNLDVNGSASISGALTMAYNQKIRSAYGPLALQYKTAADTWADGLTLQENASNNTVNAFFQGAVLPTVENNNYYTLGNGTFAWTSLYLYDGIYNDAGTQTIDVFNRRLVNGNWEVGTGTNKIILDSTTGEIDIAGGAGKIDVGTVDPPYTINGEKYSTYMAGMVGVKEEVTGTITTSEKVDGVGYRYVIDSLHQEQGSDLWVFSKTSNLKNNLNKLSVLLTAQSQAKVWYETDTTKGLVIIYSSSPTTISYRMTAPRFDSDKWGTKTPNRRSTGFIITDEDTPADPNGTILPNYLAEIVRDQQGRYTLIANGKTNQEIGSFADAIVANFRAGIATITDVVADNITINPNGSLISPLASITNLESENATISGTLFANNIKGNTVDSLNDQLATLTSQYSTASAILADLQSKYSQYGDLTSPSATSSGILPVDTTSQTASIPADIALNSITVNDIQIAGTLLASSLNSTGSDLYIQPDKTNSVYILGNLMALQPDGRVIINGDLLVAGNILAKGIDTMSATISGMLAIGNQTSTTSAEKLLALYSDTGDLVSSVNSSGSADFKQIATNELIIAASSDVITATSSSQTDTNASIGTALISVGQSEVFIPSQKMDANTLVYLTPISNTQNQVLFVKSKADGLGFTVAVTNPATEDIKFNYWLVKTR